MKPIFFPSAGALREWLGRHHATERELYIGFYRKGTGKQGLSYRDAVEESLAYGWIDGVVRRLDDERYVQRYTPRRPRSNWSLVNIRRVEELIRAGRMTPAGLAAFEAREEKRSGVYAYENRPTELSAEQQRVFRANPSAWRYFQDETPSYRRTVTWWVWSARREETRRRRLETLIADSAAGRRIRQLLAPARTAKPRRPAKKKASNKG